MNRNQYTMVMVVIVAYRIQSIRPVTKPGNSKYLMNCDGERCFAEWIFRMCLFYQSAPPPPSPSACGSLPRFDPVIFIPSSTPGASLLNEEMTFPNFLISSGVSMPSSSKIRFRIECLFLKLSVLVKESLFHLSVRGYRWLLAF